MESIVVKIGGAAGLDLEGTCADLARIIAAGTTVTVVHGGSAEIDRLADRLGQPTRYLAAPDGVRTRYTDRAAMEIVTLALAGAVKPRLVAMLTKHHVRAVGLTGIDGGLLRATPVTAVRAVSGGRTRVVRGHRSGGLHSIDVLVLRDLHARGWVPVLSPPALGVDDEPVNVDADRVAAAVAGALRADALIMLTAAGGVLSDPADPASRLAECHLPPGRPPSFARDGMARKLAAAATALADGVPIVMVGDGRTEKPVSAALGGVGTRILVGVGS